MIKFLSIPRNIFLWELIRIIKKAKILNISTDAYLLCFFKIYIMEMS